MRFIKRLFDLWWIWRCGFCTKHLVQKTVINTGIGYGDLSYCALCEEERCDRYDLRTKEAIERLRPE